MNTQNTNTNVFRKTEELVRKNNKRKTLARFLEIQVKEGKDIEEYVGKPMNAWDYNALYLIIQEHDNKQQTKLELEEKPKQDGGTREKTRG